MYSGESFNGVRYRRVKTECAYLRSGSVWEWAVAFGAFACV